MLRHAARATPWLALGVAAALTTLLLRVLQADPYVFWPLQGIAVGFVGAASAWAFDEPSASIVDTLPRGLRWRTTARGLVVLAVAGWWLMSVWWVRSALFGHAADVATQGFAAMLGVTSVVTWLRRRHVPSPANRVSAAVVATAVLLALARPVPGRLPLLPYTAAGPWTASNRWWTTIALISVLSLAVAVAEPRLRGRRRARWHHAPAGSATTAS